MPHIFRTLCLVALLSASVDAVIVYSNDFDGNQTFAPGVTGSISGGSDIFVAGLAGLGNPGNTFAGNLRQHDGVLTLQLNNLPYHTGVDLDLLLTTIDTWDGLTIFNGFPSPDVFNIFRDSLAFFSESFRNSTQATDVYWEPGEIGTSYMPPVGGSIATGTNGFGDVIGQSAADGAYDLSLEPSLSNIPHTGSSLTITFFPSGSGWQGDPDESFGIDNLQVTLLGVPTPGTLSIVLIGGAMLLWRRGRAKA
jgi:hypothetical protein